MKIVDLRIEPGEVLVATVSLGAADGHDFKFLIERHPELKAAVTSVEVALQPLILEQLRSWVKEGERERRPGT